jgi:hypothetical protein
LGASISAVLMLIGDELGLYEALAEGPATSADLAEKTGTNERYIREWLGNQASGGYIEYDASTGQYSMTEEQALCLANPNGPVDLPGAYMVVQDLFQVESEHWTTFVPGRAWSGASTMRVCSAAPSDSSELAITRTF